MIRPFWDFSSGLGFFLLILVTSLSSPSFTTVRAADYLDNQTLYQNQDPATETRRSEHFRLAFGHFNRDSGTPMTEELAQGNLQMFEQMWRRWVVDLGLHDLNESATQPDGEKYRANFNFLMTWNDGGGGGAYSSMDGNGFFYAMANPAYCRFDPPSGATPHEFGHAWEGTCAGFNGSDSSGAWWECTANWLQLQFLNSYPQASAYLYNAMYYPAHGRDYYDSFMIWEAAREDVRYGAAWVNNVWTNATPEQRENEFIINRMIRCDSSGSADKAGAINDLWGTMASKMVTWDYERQQWLGSVNRPDDGTHWEFYQRCRTPLVKIPGVAGWYRPARAHLPMEFGFNIIPLAVTNSTTIYCRFQPLCDPVRGSDWRACLVAVNRKGEASYSILWNAGTNSFALSADQDRAYLVVIATPRPMKIADPAWRAYLTEAGRQFPYTVTFVNASPAEVSYARPANGVVWKNHVNPDGSRCTNVASGAVVDATAYVSPTAMVLGAAQVRGTARIEDYAVVKDNTRITDAVISGHAVVEDQAKIYGHAKVRDWARVFGYAEVFENARVIEHASCGDGTASTHSRVYGDAVVKGTTYVYDPSTLNGCLIMDGDSANGNGTTPASRGVHFGWGWGQDRDRFSALQDNGYLFLRHTFDQDNAVFALDEFGINHGYLMNGCRSEPDTEPTRRGGRVLQLDGQTQYVELHNAANDFANGTVTVWLRSSGGPAGQRVWSMGDGGGKVMYLTPNDPQTASLRFFISDGERVTTLEGPAVVPGAWTHVAVGFAGAEVTLYVNGVPVASDAASVTVPDRLNAPLMQNANFLGRGNEGGFFHGAMDDFQVYSKALTDSEVAELYATTPPLPFEEPPDIAPPSPTMPTWLVAPTLVTAGSVAMSVTPGTDESGWVEYYFACTSGPGHDSGWVSFNRYTDLGIPPGSPVSYRVAMRDRASNLTSFSAEATATPHTSEMTVPSFLYGPVGVADGQITMQAIRPTNGFEKVEYKFDCTTTPGASSGWQSSPQWTHTGLATGATAAYTVAIRDERGRVSPTAKAASARAWDEAAPRLPMSLAHWEMQPYATVDNTVSMTATEPEDAAGVEYQFHCVSGGAPDSPWQTSRTFVTPHLPDGTYVYQYRIRDMSPRQNTSGYSSACAASISPTTGYHECALSRLPDLPDDALVAFPGTVMRVGTNSYYVKDLVSDACIKVRPSTSNQVTSAFLALKNVAVKGHLYSFEGVREVTFASLTVTGDPVLYSVSGRITTSSGAGIAGATVCVSDTRGAAEDPISAATADAEGCYTIGLPAGTWFVAARATAYNTSSERKLLVVGAALTGVNFSLSENARVMGTVKERPTGQPLAEAVVYFSRSAGASSDPSFTAITDIDGGYQQPVQDGIWYVSAGGPEFYSSPDKIVTVHSADVREIDFALSSSARVIPAAANLLFSVTTEALPKSGSTGPWPVFQPAGEALAPIGSPTIESLDGVKWVRNRYSDGDGFILGHYLERIPCNGVTIAAAVRPSYLSVGGEPRGEIVDMFYDRLALAVSHTDGRLMVARGYWNDWGPALPNDQTAILSLVVQPDGAYEVYANGLRVMAGGAVGDWTSIDPDHSLTWGNNPDFTHYISVGRNAPDGWSTFNGHIGDVFVYTNALSTAERLELEADLTAKFLHTNHVITVVAGPEGYINPGGNVLIEPGGQQTFTINSLPGYVLADLVVDGNSVGPTNTWTFANVTTSHRLTAVYKPLPPPMLTFRYIAPEALEISWPQNTAGTLLTSPSLGNGMAWAEVGTPPTVSDGMNRVTVVLSGGAAYYALGL